MAILYFLCGVQGSGKSTFSKTKAKEYNARIVSSDEIRNRYPNMEESGVFPKAYELASQYLNNDENVIFDVTNITKGARIHNLQGIKSLLKKEIKVICYLFITERSICVERVKIRNTMKGERYLPLEVIDAYINKFEAPTLDEGYDELIQINNFGC